MFLGKVLDDSKTVAEYNIEEKNFLVIMVTKVCISIVIVCGQMCLKSINHCYIYVVDMPSFNLHVCVEVL